MDGTVAGRDEPRRLPVTPDEEFLHGEPPLSTLFPGALGESPLEIEFGTGKGRFLIESGRLHPGRRFLGIERSLAYYRIARDRIAGSGLANVRVLRADAAEVAERLPPGAVSAFHAYFLDPWPKKKQQKRRLLGEHFFAAAAIPARSGGLFRIVTDHADYGDAIARAIDHAIAAGTPWQRAAWDSAPPPPPTHYELKYRAAGRSFRRFLLVRT
ncbi:MAG TPA: hypothetical protein VFS34_06290 [Thermoanaerobaculia bacterium]|nr:hypothetical protein [Thermoanaerobaculia bacterium]